MPAGQTAKYNLQLSATSVFTGPVTLACIGAPKGSICTPKPAGIMLGAAVAPVTVSVATSGGAGAVAPPSGGGLPLWPWLVLREPRRRPPEPTRSR